MMKNPTVNSAREFWRDLMGTLWHDANTTATHGTMSASLVASHMGISEDTASAFLWKCVELGLTDRQNGGFVV